MPDERTPRDIDRGGPTYTVDTLRDMRRESPGEFQLAVATAAVVIAIGVVQGIVLAMGLSLLRHVRHSYRPHSAVLVDDGAGHWRQIPAAPGAQSGPGLLIFQFGADLFYANASRFAEDVRGLVDGAPTPVRWLVVDAGAITSVDYSAARVLRAMLDDLSRDGVVVLLVHAEAPLLADLRRRSARGRAWAAAAGRAPFAAQAGHTPRKTMSTAETLKPRRSAVDRVSPASPRGCTSRIRPQDSQTR